MARASAVWGIDIGQCALKALRARDGDDDIRIVAEAFDYIEYPRILSQPEANPAELIHDALELFLSRNSVRGDRVVISVSGQSGLARFIKLPPVESKKIPDIVKYEAKQQIPFSLDDVVWDYQQMAGGSESDGFALETEVGLFAMKRDQVYRALKPFEDAKIEVDVIQLTPLAIYNYTVFDRLNDLPPPETYDPENPPASMVVLSLGTETTDLVVTNGYRVWQRSIPIGGSHFTKALTKELRLTFAKAEHLKRNATQADDPKSVFQAMRPVFVDLLTEVQRSIGYFTTLDRKAKIGQVIALGNAMKLPGLQRYLSQNLGYPVVEIEAFRGLGGSSVIGSPAFNENLLSYAVSYGLALQGLNKAKLSTNLLPREISSDRLVRAKKPWAVAMVATLLLGCMASYAGHWWAWRSVSDPGFPEALNKAKGVETQASNYKQGYEGATQKLAEIDTMGQRIVGNVDGRLLWLEMLVALDSSLPTDKGDNRPTDISDREEIYIDNIECEHFADLSVWYRSVADKIKEWNTGVPAAAGTAAGGAPGAIPPSGTVPPPATGAPPAPGAPAPGVAAAGAAPPGGAAAGEGPMGEGWVIQITGYHFHNKNKENQGAKYVHDTLVRNLEEGIAMIPTGVGKEAKPVKNKDLGIGYPVLVDVSRIHDVDVPDPTPQEMDNNAATGAVGPGARGAADPTKAKTIQLREFEFILQFSWQPVPRSKRGEKTHDTAAVAGNLPAGQDDSRSK